VVAPIQPDTAQGGVLAPEMVGGEMHSRQFECVVISDDSRVEAGGLSGLMDGGSCDDPERGVTATTPARSQHASPCR
jgi:hypothetical protein